VCERNYFSFFFIFIYRYQCHKLESDLTQLNDAINNKASPMYIIMVVHTQIHPNLQRAYNLQLQ
jgi:hypothetical protein